jgi:hypothetical protein
MLRSYARNSTFAVDTSRANTESMMNDDLESLEGDLVRIDDWSASVPLA